MGTMYAILSIAGWAFLIGLLGYLVVRGRRTDAVPTDDSRPKDD